MAIRFNFVLGIFLFSCVGWSGEPALKLSPEATKALRKLSLPGIKLNLKERCVDVNATICLHKGLLELVACTKGTKEHESILSISARPMHIHTAMLLLGASPGTPAMRRAQEGARTRWVPVDPAGDSVCVSLVFAESKGKLQEYPIQKFISPAQPDEISGIPAKKILATFPASFLFAGSHLVENGAGPRKYVCEQSGNVISISTFGDELLCLPGIHGHQNDGLVWQVNPKGLPGVGEQVILRLRPNPKTPDKK
ncbi:MAG: YdjY domain-containing protein [Verrucomicrobiota bacterium]|nr:YdjY domain-containing protein [Verrucomicrobiota bacterium]